MIVVKPHFGTLMPFTGGIHLITQNRMFASDTTPAMADPDSLIRASGEKSR